MILCTYQPVNFKFDVCQTYNALDYERRDEIKNKHGDDYIADYTKLLGKDTKPVFCFEVIDNVIQTAVKSKFVFPTNPEMFIMFETDDSICYNDVLWNSVYGITPVDDDVRNDVVKPCDYLMACHVVDCIPKRSVLYTCNLRELFQNGKLYGKARLHKNEIKTFEKIFSLSKKWYSMYEKYFKSQNYLMKCWFESFCLPVIIKQCLGFNTDMYCINPILACMPVPTIEGKMDLFVCISRFVNELGFHHDLSDFESRDDAVAYRTTYYANLFGLCVLLFSPIDDFQNAEEVGIKPSYIVQLVNHIMEEHNKYVRYFNRNL